MSICELCSSQCSDELRNLFIKWAVEWVSADCQFSSTCKCSHENKKNKIFKKLLLAPQSTLTLFSLIYKYICALALWWQSAMQQLTIKMTLRHNFISISIYTWSRCLIHSLLLFIHYNTQKNMTEWMDGERERIRKYENINQLMTISKERINLNLLTPNRVQWRVSNEGKKEDKERLIYDFFHSIFTTRFPSLALIQERKNYAKPPLIN